MKKLISLLLIISFAFSFPSCKKNDSDNGNETPNDNTQSNEQPKPDIPTIVVPEYKDYGRGSVDFKDIVYSRPDFEAVLSAFDEAEQLISSGEDSIDRMIEKIKSLESIYDHTESMYAIAEIYSHKDSSVEFWQNEFKYISTNYPAFTKAVEDLIVACASSEHKEKFEKDYFGYSLDEYTDGGIYTDELVALLAEEAAKEAEYSSLSTATVEIVYKSVGGFTFEGTADEVYKMAEEKFGKDTAEYKTATIAINNIYNERLLNLTVPIFVDLLKTRRLIADELGYDSYIRFAYENMGYDYSEDGMNDLLESVGRYVAPVAEELNSVTFSSYFQKNPQSTLDNVTLVNKLYTLYSRSKNELTDAYSYMLQHGLYDISPKSPNRYEGAFASYIITNNSPYVFMTAEGFANDYMTLAHEFGHFYDYYVNSGKEPSVDLAEVSSQGLEFLTLLRLRNELKMTEYEYLEYLEIYTILNTVILGQSFYAAFEHLAYELEYDEITAANLSKTVEEAFSLIYGRDLDTVLDPIRYVMIPHTILYPCYVESYVVSAIPALEMFFMESYRTGTHGEGFAVYEDLVKRENTELSFEEQLDAVGLSSPFDPDTVKKIANDIFYQISGKDYYKDTDTEIDAA